MLRPSWPKPKIAGVETGLRALIEYPVKTMNISLENSLYQVDTGPVAIPDLTKRYDPPLDSLRLAFVAFNAPTFADFVVGAADRRDPGRENLGRSLSLLEAIQPGGRESVVCVAGADVGKDSDVTVHHLPRRRLPRGRCDRGR